MFSRRSKRPTISMRAARGMLSDDVSYELSSNESRSVSDVSSPTFSSSSASLNSGSEYTASPPADPVVDSTPDQQQPQKEEVVGPVTPGRVASSTIPSQLSPQMELRLNLLPRIGEFRSRGWITSAEEDNLTNILSHTKYDDKFEADEAAVMVKRKLNQIQRREIERLETEATKNEMFEDSPENKGDNNDTNDNNRESTNEQIPHSLPPSILGNSRKGLHVSFDATQSNKNQSTPQEPNSKSLFSAAMQKKITKSPLKFDSKNFGHAANKENSVNDTLFVQAQSSSILDEIYTPHEATRIRGIDQTVMEDLFVEMSFFARLGFLQPPSCLKCAHRQTVGHKQQDSTTASSEPCNRLVAWRKDANVLLHPDKLEGNLLVVSCASATKLHKGETVSNYAWDRKQRLFKGP
eukprot:scaffold666213_cov51-Attheya_sp.AAC.1